MSERKYIIKLPSGQQLGPIRLSAIGDLIEQGQIQGTEMAQLHPSGDWVPIASVSSIAALLQAKKGTDLFGTTIVLDEDELKKGRETIRHSGPIHKTRTITKHVVERTKVQTETQEIDEDQTQVGPLQRLDRSEAPTENKLIVQDPGAEETILMDSASREPIQEQVSSETTKQKSLPLRRILLVVLLAFLGWELWTEDSSEPNKTSSEGLIRAAYPQRLSNQPEPQKSQELYQEAMSHFVRDDLVSYRNAARLLLAAAGLDESNVKAFAMLAATYVQLIDLLVKDEKAPETIKKLISTARSSDSQLVEITMAEIEFLLMMGQADAALRLLDQQARSQLSPELYFYVAHARFDRGRYGDTLEMLQSFPKGQVFSPRVHYLKGQTYERLGDVDSALAAYREAMQHPAGSAHAKSWLRYADLFFQKGTIANAEKELRLLGKHSKLLAPRDAARAFFLRAKFFEESKNYDQAISEIQKALAIRFRNPDYRLLYYTLQAREEGLTPELRKDARMYFFLSEGQKAIVSGRIQEGLDQFIRARQINEHSRLPIIAIGDAFELLHDLRNARKNYEFALEADSDQWQVWAKLTDVLIRSYEWDDATKAMQKLQAFPNSGSRVNQLSGDLYRIQGQYREALVAYRQAMDFRWVRSEVYLSYGKTLMDLGEAGAAPFFFALAQRDEDTKIEAMIELGRNLSQTESPSRAIEYLKEKQRELPRARAEVTAAIGHLQFAQGQFDQAEKTLKKAIRQDEDEAFPYRVLGDLYWRRAQEKKSQKFERKALSAYRSYSERDPSAPEGYFRRQEIFIAQKNYSKAFEELDKVFGVFPHYPNLHYYRGRLYALMGDRQSSVREIDLELKIHPGNLTALLFLGREYIKYRNLEQAMDLFSQAMAVAPQSAEAKQMAGYTNYLMKNYEGAVALYQAALQFDDGNPVIYKRLGMAYRALGRESEAQGAFGRYLQLAPDAPDRHLFQ